MAREIPLKRVGTAVLVALICVLLGAAIMALVSAMTQPRYVGTASVTVAITDDANIEDLPELTSHVLRSMPSLAEGMRSPRVLDAVARESGVDRAELASNLSVTYPVNSQVLRMSVRWTDARTAAALVDRVADETGGVVTDVLAGTEIDPPSYEVRFMGDAPVPTAPASPSWPKNLTVGALVGGALGWWLAGRMLRRDGRAQKTIP